jgi:hypothetical protein
VNSKESTEKPDILPLCLKLRGIGYLLERRGSDPTPPIPEDMEAIHKGIGMIISELAEELELCRDE